MTNESSRASGESVFANGGNRRGVFEARVASGDGGFKALIARVAVAKWKEGG